MTPQQTVEFIADLKGQVQQLSLEDLEREYVELMNRHGDPQGQFRKTVESEGELSDDWFVAQHQIRYRRIQELKKQAVAA